MNEIKKRDLYKELKKMKEQRQDVGTKYDEDKIRTDLLSIPALLGTADVLTMGTQKYGDRNWEKN
jgi:hypothetical protein